MKERTVYTQLRPEERVVISSMKPMGESARAMGRVLAAGVARSAESFVATAVERWATRVTRLARGTRNVAALPGLRPSST